MWIGPLDVFLGCLMGWLLFVWPKADMFCNYVIGLLSGGRPDCLWSRVCIYIVRSHCRYGHGMGYGNVMCE